MAAQTRSAIVVKDYGQAVVDDNVPFPKLGHGDVLVKATAYALNPVDNIFIDGLPHVGAVQGCDYAGVVEQVGEGVGSEWQTGTRIAGYVPANNKNDHEAGAFGSFLKAPSALQMKVPDNLTDAEAASMCVGIMTAGLSLFDTIGLSLPSPWTPDKDPVPVLVYGGSTSTGAIGIQLAKAANLQVVTTCSPSSFDYVRSLGATHVFDYNSPSCAEEIRKAVPGLKHCLDCASKGGSGSICAASLAAGPGAIYRSLLPVEDFSRDDVDSSIIQSFEIFGKPYFFGPNEVPVRTEAFEFAKQLMTVATQLIADGKLKPHKLDVRTGGLDGVLKGLAELKAGKIRGAKVVITV